MVHLSLTDPAAHGHAPLSGSPASSSGRKKPVTDQEREAARVERRDVVESNRAWRSAETVRRRWLKDLAGRKAAPKGAARFLAVAQARHPEVIGDIKGNHLAAELLGLPNPRYGISSDLAQLIENAATGRVQLLHLTVTLAAFEAATFLNDWRRPSPRTQAYLTYLAEIGYPLSPVELRAQDSSIATTENATDEPDPGTDDGQRTADDG